MKRVVLFCMLAVFVLIPPTAMPFWEKVTKKQINCCVSGKCEKTTKKTCKEARGKVVRDCKACKKPSAYGPGRPKNYEKNPPAKGARGEYDTWDKEGKRYYHGKSETNLPSEIEQAKRRGKLPEGGNVTYYEATPGATGSQIREHERRKIEEHQPPGNQRGGGGGRLPSSED